MEGNSKLKIELSKDEALVIFDWLYRLIETEKKTSTKLSAEYQALANLEALLERQLAEPFCLNYQQIIEDARSRIIGDDSTPGA